MGIIGSEDVPTLSEEQVRTFAAQLRTYRQSVGWTQADLAERVGVSKYTISAVENGRVTPSVPLFLALAGVFSFGATMSEHPALTGVASALGLHETFKKLFERDPA
jgi:DNA-binding XRE family transcriptional regulator